MSLINQVKCDRCGKREDHDPQNPQAQDEWFSFMDQKELKFSCDIYKHLCPSCKAQFELFMKMYDPKSLGHFEEYELQTGHVAWRCAGLGEETSCMCADHAGLMLCVRCGQAEKELDDVCRGHK